MRVCFSPWIAVFFGTLIPRGAAAVAVPDPEVDLIFVIRLQADRVKAENLTPVLPFLKTHNLLRKEWKRQGGSNGVKKCDIENPNIRRTNIW